MSEIHEWLEKLEKHWTNKNPDKVLDLFTDNVTYFERPDQRLDGKELRKEWRGIKDQEEIELTTEVFSEASNRFTVQWSLSYTENGKKTELDGVYLIVLNDNGLCKEFWQYCQIE